MTRFVAIVLLLFVCVASAQAASTSTQVLKRKAHVSSTVVRWYEHTAKGRFVRRPGFAKCSLIRSSSAAGRCYRHRLNYRWHKERLQKIVAILHPQPVVSHWTMWRCITHGPSFNDTGAHEGNGHNGSYTGPLGMTTPWAGHMPSTGDWVTAPLAEVYGDAETEFARNGYSRSWLGQQWPRTSVACLRYA
jgi:hypothetical protein